MEFCNLLQLLCVCVIDVSAHTASLSLELSATLDPKLQPLYGKTLWLMSDENNPINGKVVGEILRGILPEIVSNLLPHVGALVSKTLGSIIPHRHLEAPSNYVLPTLEYALNVTFTRSYADIIRKKKCELSHPPWSCLYWPSYGDTFNYKWAGPNSKSLVTKYANAFGIDPVQLADAISLRLGIDFWRANNAKSCESQADCDQSIAVTSCVRREKEQNLPKVCVVAWFGSCEAWTIASMLHREPQCAVEYNGVKFEIVDIKGLLTYMYNKAPIYVSMGGLQAKTSTVARDEYGRPSALEVRDLIAPDYLIAMVNLICILDRSFAIDREPLTEMWNHPMQSFEVTSEYEVDPIATAKQAFGTENFPYQAGMAHLYYMETKFCWVTESASTTLTTTADVKNKYVECRPLNLLIEVDKEGTIIGGEYYQEDQKNIDYLWTVVTSLPIGGRTPENVPYANILQLYELSQQCH